eukprot:12188748-Prorocentrum_lima.AAC.1
MPMRRRGRRRERRSERNAAYSSEVESSTGAWAEMIRSGPEGSLRSTARARGEGLWEPTTAEAAFSCTHTWTPNCPRREAV